MLRWNRFNTYLLLGCVMILCGCKTSPEREREKQVSLLRVHLETPEAGEQAKRVPVYRENPVMIPVQTAPFITEEDVAEAKVVEVIGGFTIQVQLDRHGTFLLEQYTGGNRGKRLAIFGAYGGKNGKPPKTSRWLAAPVIKQRVTDGLMVFTPDASREESDTFVLGLNNAAKVYQKSASQW